jgi:hypothetical protein
LLDYKEQWSFLEASQNPFAKVVMAHLLAQETRKEMANRLQWKLRLVKGLYEQGFSREDILELFRFIDWLMALPEEMERRFDEEITHYEEEKQMSYITSVERISIQKGIQQGRLQNAQEAVLDALEARFATVPSSIVGVIHTVEDLSLLKQLLKQAVTVDSLKEFEQRLNGDQYSLPRSIGVRCSGVQPPNSTVF